MKRHLRTNRSLWTTPLPDSCVMADLSGVWRREDGSVMLPINLRRASLRERLYVIRLGWRACHNVRLTLFMIGQYLRPSAQVCDYERWTTS